MSTLAEPYPAFRASPEAIDLRARLDANPRLARQLRLALVHDKLHEPTELASILLNHGLPPNAGVLPLGRGGELATGPPEAIVLAVDLRRPEGLAAVRALRRALPTARVVVVARDPATALVRQTLNAGADAYVPERDAADALAPAVWAVVAGLVCVPRVTRRLVSKPTFSHREKQVLDLLVAGMTNAQIAERLYLSESTIKSHVTSAFAKLGVRSRKDAAAVLLDPAEGLIGIALSPESAAHSAG